MPKRFGYFFVFAFCFTSIILGVFCLRLDFSQSTAGAGDILSEFSSSAWVYFGFVIFGLVAFLHLFGLSKMRFLPILLVMILFVVYPVAQYPAIQSWDSYLHGTTTQEIVYYGHIPSSAELSAYSGYLQYPSAFFIQAFLSVITGIPIIESGILLFALLNVVIVLLLVLLGNYFLGKKIDWLVPIIYFIVVFEYSTAGLHYAPQFLGQIFYFLSILVLFKLLNSGSRRTWGLLLIMVLATAVTVHSFSMIYLITVMLALFLFGHIKRISVKLSSPYISLNLMLLVFVLTFSWYVFYATGYLGSALSFSGLVTVETFITSAVATPPGQFSVLLQLYRYGTYIFFGLIAVLGLWRFKKQQEKRFIFGLITGVILGTLAMFPTPVSWGGYRFFYYGGVILAILAAYFLIDGYNRNIRSKILVKVTCSVLPILVITTFLVSSMYISNYSTFIHEDDISAAKFVVKFSNDEVYANAAQAHTIAFSGRSDEKNVHIGTGVSPTTAKILLNSSSLNLQNSLRQESFYGFGFVSNDENLIYSNGLNNVYRKPDIFP